MSSSPRSANANFSTDCATPLASAASAAKRTPQDERHIVAPPKTRGGEFFAIDKAPFEAACKLGLNPAVAYLAVTRGAGRDNAASFWSVNAIEQHTGMSRPKAKAALQALIDCGLFKKERGGGRPRYRIGRSDEPQR